MIPQIPQEPSAPVRTQVANKMAYQFKPPASSTTRLYRLERGYPFHRSGTLVQAVPQFKTQVIYSPTTSNAPQTTVQNPVAGFQKNTQPIGIRYPGQRNSIV